jgi:hypothetical protein
VASRRRASTSAVDLLLSLPNGPTCYVTSARPTAPGLTATATSDGVQVTGTATSGPAAARGLFAIGSDQAVLLDWLAQPSVPSPVLPDLVEAGGESLDGRAEGGSPVGLSTTISGLTNGTTYDFMIKAVDSLGERIAGVFASATPLR